MNLAHYSIKNKVVSWMFVLLMLIGGAVSFTGLGQLEFPEFTIKNALVITPYPGASPEQVEEEVTLPLEDAIQKMQLISQISNFVFGCIVSLRDYPPIRKIIPVTAMAAPTARNAIGPAV